MTDNALACADVTGEGIWNDLHPQLTVKAKDRDLVVQMTPRPGFVNLASKLPGARLDNGNLHIPMSGDVTSKLPLATMFDRPVDTGVIITLQMDDGSHVDAAMPPILLGPAVERMLGEVTLDNPLPYAGTAPPHHTVLAVWNEHSGIVTKRIGPATTFGEIDWVAQIKTSEGETLRTCNYIDERSQPRGLPLVSLDVLVTVYDRQRGVAVATQTFSAVDRECPDKLTASAKDHAQYVDVDPALPIEWLTTRAAQP